jgi:glycosyltransferase involved in cell wall biosynthesis
MRVLWIVNTVMPDLAAELGIPKAASGSWMEDLSKQLERDESIDLHIAAVWGREYRTIRIGRICYHLLPGNGKTMLFYHGRLAVYWKKVVEEARPDLVHLHGTEYSHGLSFLRSFPEIPAIVSVQGIINRIKDVYLGGMDPWSVVRFRTFRENTHLNGMIESSILYRKNAKYEREILRRAGNANVVNYWDEATVKHLAPGIRTFRVEYNLREEFYASEKWVDSRIARHSIFTNPGNVPVKGMHILLKALAIVKESYPDARLLIPSDDPFSKSSRGRNSGYTTYLMNLMEKLGIRGNIEFTGKLDGKAMARRMLDANVVVIPSAIEGTSLMLREAMFLGVPCVAAFRGGMADFLRDKETGFLYDYDEYVILASKIADLFASPELAKRLSGNAILQAEKAHDRENNRNSTIDMYKVVLGDAGKRA